MEQRRKCASVLLRFSSKGKGDRVELFPAEQWAEGPEGLFRLRRGGRWVGGPDGGPGYVTLEALGRMLAGDLAAGLGVEPGEPRPDLRRGDVVRVPNGAVWDGVVMHDVMTLGDDPLQLADGRWYVNIYFYGKRRREWVPARGVKLKTRRS
ncbi:MAG: hypothetical protein AB7D57_06680 [Desulfovibrionaceae bacterium]